MLNRTGSTRINSPSFSSCGSELKVSGGNGTSTIKLPLVGDERTKWGSCTLTACIDVWLCVYSHHVPLSVGSRSSGCSVLASVMVNATLFRSATPTSMSSSIPISSPDTQTHLKCVSTACRRSVHEWLSHTKIKDSSFLESGCPVIALKLSLSVTTFHRKAWHTPYCNHSDRAAKISKSQTDGQHTAISLSQSAPITYLQHILQ